MLPETMTVIEAKGHGGPEVLAPGLRPVPVPAAGEVLIAVKAAGVNRPDVLQRLGLYPPPKGASDLLGLEVAGHVAACGPGAARYKIGDAVCALTNGGGYAEFCVAPESATLPVPEGLSLVEAAALPETVFTVWHNVFERGGLKPGEWLLVHGGASGIGTTAIQIGTALGAHVMVTVGSAEKARAAPKMLARGAADRGFRAAGVSDECVGLRRSGDRAERLDRGTDRQSDVHEVRAAHGARQIRRNLVNGAARARLVARAVVSNQRDVGKVLSQGEGKRPADQARTDDRHAAKGNCARHSYPAPIIE
jgi:NADPH:quinone reductase-like Zn-dependent oxidoreductase